jgi:hypothetical protein
LNVKLKFTMLTPKFQPWPTHLEDAAPLAHCLGCQVLIVPHPQQGDGDGGVDRGGDSDDDLQAYTTRRI